MDADSITLFGVTEPTDKDYIKYKKIYDLCEEEGVNLPDEVEEYFEEVDYPEERLMKKLKVTKDNSKDYITRLELNVEDIPKGVSKIVAELHWD